jgi:hypothetical protein
LIRKTLLISLLVGVELLLAAECTDVRRVPAQPVASLPSSTVAVVGVGTNTPSSIPLPTPDTALYVIENHGKPHFLEFHAWW